MLEKSKKIIKNALTKFKPNTCCLKKTGTFRLHASCRAARLAAISKLTQSHQYAYRLHGLTLSKSVQHIRQMTILRAYDTQNPALTTVEGGCMGSEQSH